MSGGFVPRACEPRHAAVIAARAHHFSFMLGCFGCALSFLTPSPVPATGRGPATVHQGKLRSWAETTRLPRSGVWGTPDRS